MPLKNGNLGEDYKETIRAQLEFYMGGLIWGNSHVAEH